MGGIENFLGHYRKIAFDTNVFISVFAMESLGTKVVPIIDAVADKGINQIITSVLVFSECAVKPYRKANWAPLDQIKLMFQMPGLQVAIHCLHAKFGTRLQIRKNLMELVFSDQVAYRRCGHQYFHGCQPSPAVNARQQSLRDDAY